MLPKFGSVFPRVMAPVACKAVARTAVSSAGAAVSCRALSSHATRRKPQRSWANYAGILAGSAATFWAVHWCSGDEALLAALQADDTKDGAPTGTWWDTDPQELDTGVLETLTLVQLLEDAEKDGHKALGQRLNRYYRLFAGPRGLPVSGLKRNPVFYALTRGRLAWVDVEAVFDRDGDGYVSFREFVNGIALVLLLHDVKDTPEHRSQLARLMFTMMDTRNTGHVAVDDVRCWLRAARSLGLVTPQALSMWTADSFDDDYGVERYQELADQELATAIISRFDANNDGLLTFDEFYALQDTLDYRPFFAIEDREEHGRSSPFSR